MSNNEEDANFWEREEMADQEMNRQQEERGKGSKPIITRYIPKEKLKPLEKPW